jgi:hypothetical protein
MHKILSLEDINIRENLEALGEDGKIILELISGM